MSPRTLIVTNDFPPRIGGIESFVADVASLLDDRVVVLTSSSPGAAAHDEDLPYPVVRLPTTMLLPDLETARAARSLLREHGIERVVFGAAAPLALLTPAVRRAGARRVLAITHGHERWWAALPGSRQLLRRIGAEVDVLSTISDYVAGRIAPVLRPADRRKLVRLAPPVDTELFTPGPSTGSGPSTRSGDIRRCIAVGRFVARKGFGTLLDAWQLLLRDWPGPGRPELVLVGDGPLRDRLHRRAAALGTAVRFTGALPRAAVVAQLQAARVYAFPVRDRLAGLDPEGLGLATLEAAACGLPVVVGRSGGAPETVRDGRSGLVVDARDPYALAAALSALLLDPARAAAMGAAGRAHVQQHYSAERARRTLRAALGYDQSH